MSVHAAVADDLTITTFAGRGSAMVGDRLWNVGHKNAGGISEYIIPGGVSNPGMADCIYPIPADPPF